MPNVRQASGQPSQPPLHDGQPGQLPAVQLLPGLPPPAQGKMQSGLMPKLQENQVSTVPQNSLVRNQSSASPQPPMQPQIQLPPHANHHALQPVTLSGQSIVSTLPPRQPQSSSSSSIRPQIQVANASYSNQQMPHLPKYPGQVATVNLGHNSQMVHTNATLKSSLVPRPPLSDAGYQVQIFSSSYHILVGLTINSFWLFVPRLVKLKYI